MHKSYITFIIYIKNLYIYFKQQSLEKPKDDPELIKVCS